MFVFGKQPVNGTFVSSHSHSHSMPMPFSTPPVHFLLSHPPDHSFHSSEIHTIVLARWLQVKKEMKNGNR